MSRMGLHRALLVLVGMCLFLQGCSDVPVVQDVNQRQANEIVSVLHAHGILARSQKQLGAGEKYRVDVGSRNYSQAVGLIHERGLPGKPEVAFEDMLASRSFVPDSREVEALRLDRALALQIEEVLQAHPGVLSARGIVRYNFRSEAPRPSASVVIRTRTESNLSTEAVFGLIGKILPGMEQDDLRVMVVVDDTSEAVGEQIGVENRSGTAVRVPLTKFLFGLRVSAEDYRSFIWVMFGVMVLIVVAGALLGYWLAYAHFIRKQSTSSSFRALVSPERGALGEPDRRRSSELLEE